MPTKTCTNCATEQATRAYYANLLTHLRFHRDRPTPTEGCEFCAEDIRNANLAQHQKPADQ